MTLEAISLPTGPIVVTSSTSRVEFSPSQVREAVQEALLDGDTLKSPQQLLVCRHVLYTPVALFLGSLLKHASIVTSHFRQYRYS